MSSATGTSPTGRRLFHEGARPTSLDVVESRTTGAGATHWVLRPTTTPIMDELIVQDGSEQTVLVDQA